jgi:hypothetical protein
VSDIIGWTEALKIGIIGDFLTFLAKMGLTVRDDPKKVVDIAGRTWGEPVNGLALSLQLKTKEDPDELASVSVAIHNRTNEPRQLMTRGWLSFFRVSVVGSQGMEAELTPYGAQLMNPERDSPVSPVTLPAGGAVEADIPIGSIYRMNRGNWRVKASCEAGNGDRAMSNTIEVTV